MKYDPMIGTMTNMLDIKETAKRIFAGENVFDTFTRDNDLSKDIGDWIFGDEKKKEALALTDPTKLAGAFAGFDMSMMQPPVDEVALGDKDLPNLNIIIRTAEGDILASETLQDAVKQGAISIVVEGIVGVTN